MPVERVTAITSLLVLPWALKFLWAPAVDALRTPAWGLRAWILSAQALMGLSLLGLLGADLGADVALVTTLLFMHAFSAATQDVAIDALAIRTTPPEERGAINAWMQGGMLLARGVFGGVSLWAEQHIGPGGVVLCLVGAVWGSGLLLVFMPPPGPAEPPPPGGVRARSRAVFAALGAALSRRITWLGLLFALIAGAAFEAVGAVAGPMLRERNHPTETVGIFYAAPVLVAMVSGAFIGGKLADRYGRLRVAGIAVALTAMGVVALAGVVEALPPGGGRGPLSPEILTLGVLYVFIGGLTASSYALFMDLTDPAIGATQFSAYMGATNLCESWAARAGGHLAGRHGYPASWVSLAAVSLLSLLVLRLIASRMTPRAAHQSGSA